MPLPNFSTIALCGASVPLKRAGAGTAMVMVHGGGGASRFLPAMQALAESFDVIVPQAPGFGGTAVPSWLESISDLANFYLVGLSLGGWVAADLALRNAGSLASLTLMDAPGIDVPGVERLDPSQLGEEEAVRANYFSTKLADEAVARAFDPQTETARLANQRLVAKLAGERRFHDPQLQRWLHRLRLPTLLIWGENDRLFPPAYGEAWQKAIAGSRLVVLPQCGHLPIQEKPEAFATLVAEFCAAVDRRAD